MFRFIFSRILQGIVVVFAVIVVTFFLMKAAPSGPFRSEKNIPEHVRANLEEYYGLDKPWYVQLGRHLKNFATLNFPMSYRQKGVSVGQIIQEGFPVSLAIAVPALIIALGLGIPLGALAALKPNQLEDRASTFVATLGICLPSFVLGPLIALIFGLKLRWFNVGGWEDASDWVLPAMTLGLIYSAYIARLTRSGLRETLSQDFIRTARAKGVSEPAVVFRHAFKLASLPVLNFLGPTAAGLFSGSFITETVFQLPGLGQHFVNSAVNQDYTLAMAVAAFYAALIVAFNLLVDVVQAILNPRIGFES